jgi:hypothetical protein
MPAPSSVVWSGSIKSDWSNTARVILSPQAEDLVSCDCPFRAEILHFVHLQDDKFTIS